MTLWQYTATECPTGESGSRPAPQRGEVVASTAGEARAALRKAGLQVIRLRPLPSGIDPAAQRQWSQWITPLREVANQYLRSRRRQSRAEMYDGMATMLDAGVPLTEALDTLLGNQRRRPVMRSFRDPGQVMLLQLREGVKAGQAFDEVVARHAGWFDRIEVAMIRAGLHNGDLPRVLRSLADRHQRSGALLQKLTGALAYPAVIALVGLGVVIFLSVHTLPQLVGILEQSNVSVPALTRQTMAAGQFMYTFWWLLPVVLLLLAALVTLHHGRRSRRHQDAKTNSRQSQTTGNRPTFTLIPKTIRRIGVATISARLAELLGTGVPMVEALRIVAPTAPGIQLSRTLANAAAGVERGDELADALDDPRWFDLEYRRLLEIGQSTGELDAMLQRIADRYQRQADRLIDRLTSLLEPVVLLTLAILVGIVVMAAVLPLVRLQEILG